MKNFMHHDQPKRARFGHQLGFENDVALSKEGRGVNWRPALVLSGQQFAAMRRQGGLHGNGNRTADECRQPA